MADEHDEHGVAGARARGQIGQRFLHVLARRPGFDERRIQIRLLRQIDDVRVGKAVLLPGRVNHHRRPLVERLRVFLVAANPGDHDEMSVLSGHGRRAEQKKYGLVTDGHPNAVLMDRMGVKRQPQ